VVLLSGEAGIGKSRLTAALLERGHRVMGISLLFTGDIVKSRVHFDQAIALYDPAAHRRWQRGLATTIGWQSPPWDH
jgi:predicted ATPase